MTVHRNPVALFLAAALLALAGIVVGTNALAHRAAKSEAIADVRARTDLLATVAGPAVPDGLVRLSPSAVDAFDRSFTRLLVEVPDVERVKVWTEDGTVVYSDETRLIGQSFSLDDDERAILTSGGTAAEATDLDAPENRFEGDHTWLLEVYAAIDSPEGEHLLLEVYYSGETVDDRQDAIVSRFLPTTLAALGLVVLLATALLWGLTRRLRRSAEEREGLLRAAVEASDAERVRIARDLHDGVVQDLAGAAFAVSALARSGRVPEEHRPSLEEAADTLRTGLRALRSLLVEIYPPDLDAEGLPAALDDLLAPAAARGITATAFVEDLGTASDPSVALVWRVAQEAVRNALRHSGAGALTVRVGRQEEDLVLEVTDDGHGFDTTVRPGRTRFGLRGMHGLIEDAGGRVAVRSVPGEGTTVRLEVRA